MKNLTTQEIDEKKKQIETCKKQLTGQTCSSSRDRMQRLVASLTREINLSYQSH